MAANYRKRQEVGGRLAAQSSSVSASSQPNLAAPASGTLTRTQVERRPAQFISAPRNRLDSDSLLDDRSSPSPTPITQGPALRRTAKSQDRLNSTGSSSTGSLGGAADFKVGYGSSGQQIGPPGVKPYAYNERERVGPGTGGNNRANMEPIQTVQGGGPNYSNVSNYSVVNKYSDQERTSNRLGREVTSNQNPTPKQVNTSVAANNRQSSTLSVPADNSSYEFEKVRLDYLRRGKLYEDTVFLPQDSSVYYSRNPPFRIDWMRAKDVALRNRQAPLFFADGIDPFDVRQGELGDCWLVAAMACLSSPEHRRLFDRVCPQGQSFQDGWYAGVFRFNFWHFGVWKQVLVDDFLPTDRGQLIFVNSIQVNEFWPALMEKAYAKMYGSYEALKGGQMVDALTDLSGGIAEEYTIRGPQSNLPNNIVNILFKSLERLSLIGCSISGGNSVLLDNGLVTGHAYSVTDVRRILMGQQPVTLIRLRNPHGDSKEWRGRWSEWSREWQAVSPNDRASLGVVKRDDGEFWMDFDDFLGNFDFLYICNLTPDSPVDVPRKWTVVEHHGRWIKGFNAGGRPSRTASHWTNPQYFMKLEDTDEDQDSLCSVLIQLMQVDRRKIKQNAERFLTIGFNIFQFEKGYQRPLQKDFFDHDQAIATSGAYINERQVSRRLNLAPGEYVLVPSTWEADQEADYYIRFFLEKGNVAEFCDEKPERSEVQQAVTLTSPEAKQQEDSMRNFFYRVSGEDMEVNPFELREAINETLKKDRSHRDVSIEACKDFVSLVDVDGSGKLSFFQFQFVWSQIQNWKHIFDQIDTRDSGCLNSQQIRAAISGAGYKVSNRTMSSIIFKFADKDGMISLDDFLRLMARLMKTFNIFQDVQQDGSASFSLEKWLETALAL